MDESTLFYMDMLGEEILSEMNYEINQSSMDILTNFTTQLQIKVAENNILCRDQMNLLQSHRDNYIEKISKLEKKITSFSEKNACWQEKLNVLKKEEKELEFSKLKKESDIKEKLNIQKEISRLSKTLASYQGATGVYFKQNGEHISGYIELPRSAETEDFEFSVKDDVAKVCKYLKDKWNVN